MRVSDLFADPKIGSNKKPLLDELKEMGTELDLQPFVREYVGGLGTIHQTLRDALNRDLRNWEKTILGAMERFRSSFPEQAAAGGNIFAMSSDEKIWLSTDFIEARRMLEEKNRNLANLVTRYVTNEVTEK